jgi:hypothetical protein
MAGFCSAVDNPYFRISRRTSRVLKSIKNFSNLSFSPSLVHAWFGTVELTPEIVHVRFELQNPRGQKPLHRAIERDEALVQQWLKKEYQKIKALAQREKAEIYFGDAAHIRSDHRAGRTRPSHRPWPEP